MVTINIYCFFKRSVCSLVIHQHILSVSSLNSSLSITLHKEHIEVGMLLHYLLSLVVDPTMMMRDESRRWMGLVWDDDVHTIGH